MRTLMPWTPALSVEIQEIDEQHKILVDMINELYDSMIEGRSIKANGEILERLIEYTKTHFVVEESVMRILGYADYDEHKKKHDAFVAKLIELQGMYDGGDHHIALELLDFMKDWLSEHILKTDKQYVPYFLKSGAKRTWLRKFW